MLGEFGLPAGEVALLEYLVGELLDGRNESVTDGVRQVLGRPARDRVTSYVMPSSREHSSHELPTWQKSVALLGYPQDSRFGAAGF